MNGAIAPHRDKTSLSHGVSSGREGNFWRPVAIKTSCPCPQFAQELWGQRLFLEVDSRKRYGFRR